MTTIYAVFLCLANVCQPTSFQNEPTMAACESRKHYMESLANPGVKVVCMKKTVPQWTPMR